MGLSGTRPADTEMVRISGVWSVLFIFVLLRILRVSGGHSKIMEVTLDELALDLLLHTLSDVARVILAIAPLDDADDAHDCDDGNDDDETEDEVGIAILHRAARLLHNDLLHFSDDFAILVDLDDLLGAVFKGHNLGSRLTLLLGWLDVRVGVLLDDALFKFAPVEVGSLLLLIGSKKWDAFDLSAEDSGTHELFLILDEVSIGLVDLHKVDHVNFLVLILRLLSLQHLELNDSGTLVNGDNLDISVVDAEDGRHPVSEGDNSTVGEELIHSELKSDSEHDCITRVDVD